MATRVFLKYEIALTDAAQVALLQGRAAASALVDDPAPEVVRMSPVAAAALYEATLMLPGDPYVAPNVSSVYFGDPQTDSGAAWNLKYPRDQATFTRKSGGLFGITALFGTITDYVWYGVFVYVADASLGADGGLPQVIATRRWIDGFETSGACNAQGNGLTHIARAASRHLDGMGFRCFDDTVYVIHSPDDMGGSASPTTQWERFYFRVTRFPDSIKSLFYETSCSPSATVGVKLAMLPSGEISVYHANSIGTVYDLGTIRTADGEVIELHRWYKLDIHWGRQLLKIFLNSRLVGSDYVLASGGLGGGSLTIASSKLGQANNGLCIDFDDWVGADIPLPTAQDWCHGSKVALVRGSALASSDDTASWAGGFRVLMQRNVVASTASSDARTSAAASKRCALDTDAALSVDAAIGGLGICAAVVNVRMSASAGAPVVQIGYTLPGVAEVLGNVTISTTYNDYYKYYRPVGLTVPVTPLAGFKIAVVKDAGASTLFIQQLNAHVEILGDFMEEDHVAIPEAGATDFDTSTGEEGGLQAGVTPWLGLHNAPYPTTQWARSGSSPLNPVVLHTGSYVGTGAGFDLAFRCPVQFLFIRNTSLNTWSWWGSSANYAHATGQVHGRAAFVANATIDPNFNAGAAGEEDQASQTIIRIGASDSIINALGTTYAYFAFEDPGRRFSLLGALRLAEGIAATGYTAATPLETSDFTPDAIILQQEQASSSTAQNAWIRGPGHTDNQLSPIAAALLTTGLAVAEGELTAQSSLINGSAQSQTWFAAFRRDDGSGDIGVPRVCQVTTWTGDGSASRTINLTPASGRRPMFGIVAGNSKTFFRDPYHTGSTSSTEAGGSSSTGITGGGIDSLSVGTLGNTNGQVFTAIIFPGSATAGNNGWSIPGEEIPVDPSTSPDDVWDPEPTETEPEPEPGEGDGDEPTTEVEFDFDTDCIVASTNIINKALSFIGVTKQVTAIETETSIEAVTARLHYSDDVSQVLRDHPWSFATRYAFLTQVAGDGAQQDEDFVQAYSATVTYRTGDTVLYGGTLYYALSATLANLPTNTTYWSTTAPTSINGDWRFAYRVPDRMMLARRIVNPTIIGREQDVAPIAFRVGADETGGLIYTNAVNPELEYTYRLLCVAAQGDSIFRRALVWKHAASLAPALAKDEKKLATCLTMYERVLNEATVRDANESHHPPDVDAEWIRGRN